MSGWTTEEMVICAIARELCDGRVYAQGIATPMVAAAYVLAQMTHAPNSVLSFTVGNSFGLHAAPLGLTRYEELTLGRALMRWTFPQVVSELLPALPITEFFRPAQVDWRGRFNNVAIGPYARPKVRLPGCGGIADVTTYFDDFYLYVPRHSPQVFVAQVDFVSGAGHGGNTPGPRKLFSDLGVFGFPDGQLAAEWLYPGVSLEQVQQQTGFPLRAAPELRELSPPTEQELHLLREVIDPLGIRDLERLGRSERAQRLRRLLAQEQEEWRRKRSWV